MNRTVKLNLVTLVTRLSSQGPGHKDLSSLGSHGQHRNLWPLATRPGDCSLTRGSPAKNIFAYVPLSFLSGWESWSLSNFCFALVVKVFRHDCRNLNPHFYSASGRFAQITRISDSRESRDSRESCESIRANYATKYTTIAQLNVLCGLEQGSWELLLVCGPFSVGFSILSNRKSLGQRPVDPCLSSWVSQEHPAVAPRIFWILCVFFGTKMPGNRAISPHFLTKLHSAPGEKGKIPLEKI